jgi:hypothetical protein
MYMPAAVLSMAAAAGLSIVAEASRAPSKPGASPLGYRSAQGFHLARPMLARNKPPMGVTEDTELLRVDLRREG